MKKLYTLLILAFLFPLQAFAQGVIWKEGVHYEVLDKPATQKPEIREYFSYWCPGCFRFESTIELIKNQMPESVNFNKVHVNFMGFTSPQNQDDATRAMMISRALKLDDKINAAIFNAIHIQRIPISGIDDLRNIFVANGVTAEDFDKTAKSFGVNNMLRRNNKSVSDYRYYLKGVPNLIINGKYQINIGRAGMTPDDYAELAIWLTSQR